MEKKKVYERKKWFLMQKKVNWFQWRKYHARRRCLEEEEEGQQITCCNLLGILVQKSDKNGIILSKFYHKLMPMQL